MHLRTRALKALIPAALAGAIVVLAAPGAGATTDSCQAQFGAQCGTFAGQDAAAAPHPVFWDDRAGLTTVGNPVTGYGANSAQDKATDWVKVEHRGIVPSLGASNAATISYSFVFAPGGVWSNRCAADAGGHTITIRVCNGLQWQRFIAQPATGGGAVVAFTGAGSNTATNGVRIRNASNPSGFALLNVAYRLYVQDTSVAPPSVRPTPDTRILVDAAPGTAVNHTLFTGNQVWDWAA